ncbi:MAG: hypothetical protein RLZZ450_7120 [Pseudomonadota bacterium]|jgi:hypothetical protein
MRIVPLFVSTLLAVLAVSCAQDGQGSGALRVLLSAEETISKGVSAGTGDENTRDFAVTYSKFLVAIGRVQLARVSPSARLESGTVYLADMRQVGEAGLEIASFDDVAPGQWSQFGYQTPRAQAGAQKLAGVTDADAQEMIDKQLTYWIEGRVERPERPVSFVLKVALSSTYSACESNGQPGIAVSEDGTSTATITLHGDHLWFNTLARGDEATITRYAQWMVDADTDGDGKVSADDLASVPAEKLFPSAKGYNLSGGPIAVSTGLDFVRAQLATQGHLNGEGECSTSAL